MIIDRWQVWNAWQFCMFVINIGIVLAGVWLKYPAMLGFAVVFFLMRIVIVTVGNNEIPKRIGQ